MADVHAGQEYIVKIPRDKVKRSQGCGLDFGGSLMKVAYAKEAGDHVEIHLITNTYANIGDVMAVLGTLCNDVSMDGGVHATGVGASMMVEQLHKLFTNSKGAPFYKPVPSEFTCVVQAVQFMASGHPINEITYEKTEDEVQKGRTVGSEMRAFRNFFNSGEKVENTMEFHTEDKFVYPFMLYMCGSAGVPVKVEADGTFQWLCHNNGGGKHLWAMGSLLTGAKTFEEFLHLAAAGDILAVDTCGIHAKSMSDKLPPVSLPDHCRMYQSGQLVGKNLGDVKKEDLAISLLSSVTRSLALDAFAWAHMSKTKQIVFVGSLIDHKMVRDEMVFHMEERHAEVSQDQAVDYHFMKNAGFLGAIGSLLMGLK